MLNLNYNYTRESAAAASQNIKERDYWLNKLSGEMVKSNFPYDYQKNGSAQRSIDSLKLSFAGETYSTLMKLSKGSDYTLQLVLVTAMTLLLNKYTGNDDIIVGMPIYRQEFEGEFINTVLPLRNPVKDNMTFRELLLQVRQTILEAVENQNYPIEALLYQLDLQEQEDDFPLFDVAILLENIHDKHYLQHITPNMVVSFFRTDRKLEGCWEYNSLRFNRATMEQIIRHLTTLLNKALNNIDTLTTDIDILSYEERKQLLLDFNNNKVDFPKDKTVCQLFAGQAAAAPDRAALIFEGSHVTYGELNQRANRLARFLRNNGLQRGELVGIMLDRSPRMVESILAVWKAGGAYFPVDPSYPLERIKYMLQKSQAPVLLTDTDEVKNQNNFARGIMVLDEIKKEIAGESGKNPETVYQPSHMAYVIFTSGSTGKPKGAMVEHLGMMNHMQAKINDLHLSLHSIIAQNAAHTFDISVWQLFTALTLGGKTVIYPNDLILEPGRFIARIIQDRVTVLEVVPSYLSTMLDILEIQGTQPLPLDFLLVTGETVKSQSVRQWFEKYPGIKMVNAYGPTEASDDITHYIMHKEPAAQRIPIGKPIQNLNIYIVDKNLKLCPIGVKGEICVSGVGVGRGYYNDEEKTREVFLEDPFIKEVSNNGKETRFYKTGDLGCWLPDGNIKFFGRKDSQVKIRGYRIELEEIEVKLSDHPGIKETVVVQKTDHNGNNFLCAYLVTNRKLEISQIRDYLLESLPDYMVPSHFIELENIPLTPNGKVDKKALPEPEIDVEEEYVAPRDELEDNLAGIWAEVLEMPKDRISIYANFFQLGGHSLSVTIMVARIHKDLDVKVQLIEVFNSPTIKELAEHIEHIISSAKENKFDPIEVVEKKEYYALSSAQKRMYISQQMQLENITYNVPEVTVLEGELDREKLESCLRQIIKRHESLRTSFQVVYKEPVQKIHEYEDIEFAVEFHEANEEKSKEIFRRFIRPFDLTKAPLLRAGLIRIEKDRHIMMVDLQHIISDGFSEDILIRDFMKLYAGEILPPPRLQYRDFSQWQNKKKQIESIKKQEAYWLEQFKGEIPVLNLATDYNRPLIKSYEGSVIGLEIDSDTTARLNQLVLEEETTLFMILLALYNVFLSKLSNQEDIVVGTGAAGRRHADLHHIIGMFVNTLALRNFPKGEKTFQAFLKELSKRTLEAFENQDYPLDLLVEKVGDKRSASREALFDAVFGFQGAEDRDLDMAGLKLKPFEGEYNITHFDLIFNGMKSKNRVFFSIMYSTKLFERETIELWRYRFLVLIESVLKNVKCKIKDLDFTTALEKELKKSKHQDVDFDF